MTKHCAPRYNIDTYETGCAGPVRCRRPGGGKRTGTVFIENGRFHGELDRQGHRRSLAMRAVPVDCGSRARLPGDGLRGTRVRRSGTATRIANIQILAFNDFHGAIELPTGSNGRIGTVAAGGVIEYLAAHIARLKAENANTVVVSAGDNIGASPLVSGMFHDEPSIEALGAAGLEISAVGNHEFDEGWEELYRMQEGGCHPVAGCQDRTPFAGASFQYSLGERDARRRDSCFRRPP